MARCGIESGIFTTVFQTCHRCGFILCWGVDGHSRPAVPVWVHSFLSPVYDLLITFGRLMRREVSLLKIVFVWAQLVLWVCCAVGTEVVFRGIRS